MILYKAARFYVLSQSTSIVLVLPKYTLENFHFQKRSFPSLFGNVITQSCDPGGHFWFVRNY